MQIKCIIIDDEFPARELLQNFIGKLSHLKLLGSYSSPLDAISVIQKGEVDLVFLDIQMPDISGVDFIKTLSYRPLIVFTTASLEYAIEGYALDVLDYLVKPFTFERFVLSVNKASNRLSLQQNNQAHSVEKVKEPIDKNDFIMVKSDHKLYRVMYKSILYIEGLREYVTFYCSDNNKYVALYALKSLEESLKDEGFLRVHRSYIINKSKVVALYGNQLKIEGVKEYIPIGKNYRDLVKALLVGV